MSFRSELKTIARLIADSRAGRLMRARHPADMAEQKAFLDRCYAYSAACQAEGVIDKRAVALIKILAITGQMHKERPYTALSEIDTIAREALKP